MNISQNASHLALITGKNEEKIQHLLDTCLDEDIGECIESITADGVFLMDIISADPSYTLLPIPAERFLEMLERRSEMQTAELPKGTCSFAQEEEEENNLPWV